MQFWNVLRGFKVQVGGLGGPFEFHFRSSGPVKTQVLLRRAWRRTAQDNKGYLTCANYDWEEFIEQTPHVQQCHHHVTVKLCVCGACLDPAETVIVVSCPKLIRSTFAKLTNKEYIKLSGDGTFRLFEDNYVLLALGVLTKHHEKTQGSRGSAFQTTFHPVFFAITNSESTETYKVLF